MSGEKNEGKVGKESEFAIGRTWSQGGAVVGVEGTVINTTELKEGVTDLVEAMGEVLAEIEQFFGEEVIPTVNLTKQPSTSGPNDVAGSTDAGSLQSPLPRVN